MGRWRAVLAGILLLSGFAAGAEPEERAYLGVSVREVEQPESGVIVLSVVPGSPAQEAGLKAGDRILTREDGVVCGVECFGERIRKAGPGARFVFRIVRDGATREAGAVLGRMAAVRVPPSAGGLQWSTGPVERVEAPEVLLRNRLDAILAKVPEAPAPPQMFLSPAARVGLDLIQITPELRRHLGGPADTGGLVGQVRPGSAAATSGIQTGDLLVAVDGRPVRGGDSRVLLLNTPGRASFKVDLIRDRRPLSVTVKLPAGGAPWAADRSRALENALQSLSSSMENQDMSRELRDRLEAVREQLQRALDPPPKEAPAGR